MRTILTLALATCLTVISAGAASAQMTDDQFNAHMKKYLESNDGQEAVSSALQAFAMRKQNELAQAQLDEQFKSPVSIEIGDSPIRGPKDAKVTIVEFSDFECPFCRRGASTMDEVLKAYPKDVRLVFKNRPLSFHKHAEPASKAAIAAGMQGKFYEFHDALFANQQKLGDAFYEETAKTLGLNVEKFKKDMASDEVKAKLKAETDLADKLGVNGTPGYFVNGVAVQGAQPFENFKRVIDRWLEKK